MLALAFRFIPHRYLNHDQQPQQFIPFHRLLVRNSYSEMTVRYLYQPMTSHRDSRLLLSIENSPIATRSSSPVDRQHGIKVQSSIIQDRLITYIKGLGTARVGMGGRLKTPPPHSALPAPAFYFDHELHLTHARLCSTNAHPPTLPLYPSRENERTLNISVPRNSRSSNSNAQ